MRWVVPSLYKADEYLPYKTSSQQVATNMECWRPLKRLHTIALLKKWKGEFFQLLNTIQYNTKFIGTDPKGAFQRLLNQKSRTRTSKFKASLPRTSNLSWSSYWHIQQTTTKIITIALKSIYAFIIARKAWTRVTSCRVLAGGCWLVAVVWVLRTFVDIYKSNLKRYFTGLMEKM